jgi:hypothetical protein
MRQTQDSAASWSVARVWTGYEVKIFYVDGLFQGKAQAGDVIGHAQDVSRRYAGITNHVHLEVREHGCELSPAELFGMCF